MRVPARGWARWRVPVGYPLAALCLWLARPSLGSVLAGGFVACAGLLIRGAAAGHLRKSQALAQTGPYARTRNPLYLGSALLAGGFAAASRSWAVAVLLGAYFVVFYVAVMRREEAELRAQYGEVFEEYARRVPLFWPRITVRGAEDDQVAGRLAGVAQFSMAQYRRNREYQAAIGTVALLALMAGLALWRR